MERHLDGRPRREREGLLDQLEDVQAWYADCWPNRSLNFTPVQDNLDLLHRHVEPFLLAIYSTERPAEITVELWYKKTRFTITSFSCRSKAREQELNNKLSEALLRAEKAELGGSNLPCLFPSCFFYCKVGSLSCIAICRR